MAPRILPAPVERLPSSELEEPEDAKRAVPAADAAEPVSARNDQPLRVLVVEENPVNQAVAAAMLDALGYCYISAPREMPSRLIHKLDNHCIYRHQF